VRVEGVKRVTLKNEPSPKYKGEGPLSLFDGTRGIANYRHKSWMGFEGDDLEITVDFGMEREIRKVGPEFLQDKAAWIFLPEDVEFFASEDGSNYRSLGSVSKKDIGGADSTGVISLAKEFKDLKTRYFRVCAHNIGKCPPGHRGAGGKAWLFADEIILE
jgi:hexosaminidase